MRVVVSRVIVNKGGWQVVRLPLSSRVLTIEGDRLGKNLIHMWFEGEHGEDEKMEDVYLRVIQTDVPFPSGYFYVGSAVGISNRTVHIFQTTKEMQKLYGNEPLPEGDST